MALHGRRFGGNGQGNGHGNGSRGKPTDLFRKVIEAGDKRYTIRSFSNARGKAVEVREFAHGRENLIVIPSEHADSVMDTIDEALEACETNT